MSTIAPSATHVVVIPSYDTGPLVRKETTVTAGFGISWIFATSSQRVLTDD
jgi:hypothetical protein